MFKKLLKNNKAMSLGLIIGFLVIIFLLLLAFMWLGWFGDISIPFFNSNVLPLLFLIPKKILRRLKC